jgi:hypothetical protein
VSQFDRVVCLRLLIGELAEVEKKSTAEAQEVSSAMSAPSSPMDATMIGRLFPPWTPWFGGSNTKESPPQLATKRNLLEGDEQPGPSSTDWRAIGYHNYGHWRA